MRLAVLVQLSREGGGNAIFTVGVGQVVSVAIGSRCVFARPAGAQKECFIDFGRMSCLARTYVNYVKNKSSVTKHTDFGCCRSLRYFFSRVPPEFSERKV